MDNAGRRERLLITGPSGRVGPYILPLLRPFYALRLLDIHAPQLQGDDEFIPADIRDTEIIQEACRDVRAIIHMAAISDEDDFRTKLLPININGTYSVFEAARLAQVPKIVFISTGQTVLNYGRGTAVSTDMLPRPLTVYACTKLFGEALARYYADHWKLKCICIRLGWFQGYDSPLLQKHPEMLGEWCSPRDFAQLLRKSVEADLDFGIFFGVSNNSGRYWDISNAQKLLGYDPQDDGLAYAKAAS